MAKKLVGKKITQELALRAGPKKNKTEYRLPPDVIETDKKYPDHKEHADGIPEDVRYGGLRFYLCKGMGWILLTLQIHSGKHRYRPSGTARSYGISVDGKLCRVGHGPHVEAEVVIYVTKKNIDRLLKYVDLWKQGSEKAGMTRDRISSRRAQGQLMRMEGRHSWKWDV